MPALKCAIQIDEHRAVGAVGASATECPIVDAENAWRSAARQRHPPDEPQERLAAYEQHERRSEPSARFRPDRALSRAALIGARAIPVVIVLDESFTGCGWWGSRPAELQAWVMTPDARRMEPSDRYREVRRWYARDRGRSTLREVLDLLDHCSPDRSADDATQGVPPSRAVA